MKTIRGQTSPAYHQTDVERPVGDTHPFLVTEMIENRWSDTGNIRDVQACRRGFHEGLWRQFGGPLSPSGPGADARKNLPG